MAKQRAAGRPNRFHLRLKSAGNVNGDGDGKTAFAHPTMDANVHERVENISIPQCPSYLEPGMVMESGRAGGQGERKGREGKGAVGQHPRLTCHHFNYVHPVSWLLYKHPYPRINYAVFSWQPPFRLVKFNNLKTVLCYQQRGLALGGERFYFIFFIHLVFAKRV